MEFVWTFKRLPRLPRLVQIVWIVHTIPFRRVSQEPLEIYRQLWKVFPEWNCKRTASLQSPKLAYTAGIDQNYQRTQVYRTSCRSFKWTTIKLSEKSVTLTLHSMPEGSFTFPIHMTIQERLGVPAATRMVRSTFLFARLRSSVGFYLSGGVKPTTETSRILFYPPFVEAGASPLR